MCWTYPKFESETCKNKEPWTCEPKDLYHEKVEILNKLKERIWRNNKLEMRAQTMVDGIPIFVIFVLWGDFLSLYSWSHKVIVLGGTYAIDEGKMQTVSLDVKLHLYLKLNSLPPMHHLWFGTNRYIFWIQTPQILELYVKMSPT